MLYANRVHENLTLDSQVASKDTIVLPGVGTFGQAMNFLNSQGLTQLIQRHAANGGQILGICLGMQLLFDSSDESPNIEGLHLLSGHCSAIPKTNEFRVPHIGWNQLHVPVAKEAACKHFSAFDGFSSADFYFVHSYVVHPHDSDIITACFAHPSGLLCAAVASNSIMGVQFHPEKSGSDGYALLNHLLGYSD